jgi:hypothetical protein
MRYCYECGHITAGEPLFCNSCGRSYDVKLCPRLHVNPRNAECCSQCGSRELSTPQPKIPMSLRLLALLARLGLGLLLFYATLSLIVALLRSPQVQQSLVACGFLLAALWFLWSKLPEWFREAIRSFWKNRGNDDDQA